MGSSSGSPYSGIELHFLTTSPSPSREVPLSGSGEVVKFKYQRGIKIKLPFNRYKCDGISECKVLNSSTKVYEIYESDTKVVKVLTKILPKETLKM